MCIRPLPDGAEQFVRPGGRDIWTLCFGYLLHICDRSLKVKSRCLPVGNTGRVIVDLFESESVEPARGSWRHVSQSVVSIHNYRFVAPEDRDRFSGEGLEGDVHRSRDVAAVELTFGKHIDNLAACIDEFEECLAIDVSDHVAPSLQLAVAPWWIHHFGALRVSDCSRRGATFLLLVWQQTTPTRCLLRVLQPPPTPQRRAWWRRS